jgi:hypothetical protein
MSRLLSLLTIKGFASPDEYEDDVFNNKEPIGEGEESTQILCEEENKLESLYCYGQSYASEQTWHRTELN